MQMPQYFAGGSLECYVSPRFAAPHGLSIRARVVGSIKAVEVLPSTHLEVSHSWEMESATTADIQQTEDTMAPPDGAPTAPRTPPSGTLLRVLTHTQNASAAAFGMFMGIHLAAPIAASFGGTSAADGVMVSGIAGEWFRPGVRPGARCDARHCRHAFLPLPSP